MSHSHTSRRATGAIGLVVCSLLTACAAPSSTNQLNTTVAEDAWFKDGQAAIAARLDVQRYDGRAKNVILFVGDGMGISTITAGRIFAGQRNPDGSFNGKSGEEHLLAFDKFPHVALVKTYETDAQVADSAGTASAMATGIKTRRGIIALTADQPRGQCAGTEANKATTILQMAEEKGLATGIVSTARLTHATPASFYAHAADRDWEADVDVRRARDRDDCADIARQMIELDAGDGIDVALGGGRAQFLPRDVRDPEHDNYRGRREDGRNLIDDWSSRHTNGRYIWNRAQFDALDWTAPGPVLGLFEPSHMQWEADRSSDLQGEPSLAELTSAAISKLSQDQDGFFLMVEGARIDHAHHGNNARRALEDTRALSDAVAAAMEATNPENTLILVTADHSHVFTIAGYQGRGADILGLASEAADGKPYTTLGYANGPSALSAFVNSERRDPSQDDLADVDYQQQALVPLPSETHAGEDVALFGYGARSHLVSGVMEQNVIFHIMTHAYGW